MVNFKEHFKLTALYTFFAAFPAVLQLVVYPVIEGNDRLGAEDFGYLAVAEALLSFLVMFALYGMAITISRYYFDVKDDPDKYRKLVSTIFTGVVIRGGFILLLVVVFADFFGGFFKEPALADFRQYGHYLAIIAFNRTVIMVALALYRNAKMVQMFVVVSLLSGLARSVFQVVGVLYFDLSFIGYLTGTAIGGGTAALVILIHTYARCGFHYSRSVTGSLTKYAFPLFMADIVVWGIMFFDRFLLVNDPESLGIYDNALKFAMGIQFVTQGLSGYVQPELYRMFNHKGERDDKGIRSQSNLFMAENIGIISILMLPVMVFIAWFYETSLVISAGLIPLVFARYILYAQYQIFLWPILFLKRTSAFLYVNLAVLVLVIALNLWLIPHYGYYGSILAALAGGLLQVGCFYLIQQRLMPFRWNMTKMIWFPLMFIAVMMILEWLKHHMSLDPFVAAGLLTTFSLVFLAVMYRKEFQSIAKKYLR